MTFLDVNIARKIYGGARGQGGVLALSSVRFSVPEGQFACLLGPSGCGKTTLLHAVAGLDPTVEGNVTVGGVPAASAPAMGYMFQTPRLMPWLTVLENVRLVADDAALREQRAERLLTQMQLGSFMGTYPNRLSGGMQRRVSLARAFVNQPRLLLLDEPFISLDSTVADLLRTLLLDLWQQHKASVLFVTHDLREALMLGDRLLFMSPSPGRIVLDLPIELPRPRHSESHDVSTLRERLVREYPAVVGGLPAETPTNIKNAAAR